MIKRRCDRSHSEISFSVRENDCVLVGRHKNSFVDTNYQMECYILMRNLFLQIETSSVFTIRERERRLIKFPDPTALLPVSSFKPAFNSAVITYATCNNTKQQTVRSVTFLEILFEASSSCIQLLLRQLEQAFARHLWEVKIGKFLMQHRV